MVAIPHTFPTRIGPWHATRRHGAVYISKKHLFLIGALNKNTKGKDKESPE
jgi:hypothetical protein